MYKCVKCVILCLCKFDDLILLVSLDCKTSWKMFTQRGEVSNRCELYEQQCCF